MTSVHKAASPIRACQVIDIPVHADARGKLSVVEAGRDIHFDIQRAYWLYDLPTWSVRGAHAHRTLWQLVIAINGNFEISIDDGCGQLKFRLDRPSRGLIIPPMIWRELTAFSQGAVALVLASSPYHESDYYRSYAEFLASARRPG